MWFLWPVPVFLGAAVVLIALVSAGRRVFRGTVGWRRAFWCPFLKTDVNVDFKRSIWDGSLVDVVGCTAFSPAHDVRCEKACLLLARFPPVKAEAAAASR